MYVFNDKPLNIVPDDAVLPEAPKNYSFFDYYNLRRKENSYIYNRAVLENRIQERLDERNAYLKSRGIEITSGSPEAFFEGEDRIEAINQAGSSDYIKTIHDIINELGTEYREEMRSVAPDNAGILKRFTVGLAGSLSAEIHDFFTMPDLPSRAAVAAGLITGGAVLGPFSGAAITGGIQSGIRQSNENQALEILSLPKKSVWSETAKGAVESVALMGMFAGIGKTVSLVKGKLYPTTSVAETLGKANAEVRSHLYQKVGQDHDDLLKNKKVGVASADIPAFAKSEVSEFLDPAFKSDPDLLDLLRRKLKIPEGSSLYREVKALTGTVPDEELLLMQRKSESVHEFTRALSDDVKASVDNMYALAGRSSQLVSDYYKRSTLGLTDSIKMAGTNKLSRESKVDFFRAVFGEKTGDRVAQRFARVFKNSSEFFRTELGKRGIILEKLKDFHHNAWDSQKIANNKDAFVRFLISEVNWKAIATREGRAVNPEKAAADIASKIIRRNDLQISPSGNIRSPGDSAVNSIRGSRFIIWNDGTAYFNAMDRFGKTTDPIKLIEDYAHSMSVNLSKTDLTAGVSFEDFWSKYVRPEIVGLEKENFLKLDRVAMHKVAPILDGTVGDIEKSTAAKIIDTLASLNIARITAKAAITLFLEDKGTMFLANASFGSPLRAFRDSMKFPVFKKLSPDEAVKLGVIAETMAKYADAEMGGLLTSYGKKILDLGRTISGIEYVGSVMRQQTVIVTQRNLGEMAALAFKDLPPIIKEQFGRYGITEAQWARASHFLTDWEGMKILNPKQIKFNAANGFELDFGTRLSNWLNDFAESANPGRSFKGRVQALHPEIMNAARNGEFAKAKILESVTMFWQVAWTEYNAIWSMINNHYRHGNYSVISAFIAQKTIMSMMRVYLGDLSAGRIPDPADPSFVIRAANFSGILGPVGELAGEAIMTGIDGGDYRDAVARAAGPAVNIPVRITVDSISRIAGNKQSRSMRGDVTKQLVDAVNLTERHPLIGLVLNRMVFEEMYKALDPDAYAYYAKRNYNARKRGLEFWWQEGSSQPENITRLGRRKLREE